MQIYACCHLLGTLLFRELFSSLTPFYFSLNLYTQAEEEDEEVYDDAALDASL